MLQQVKYNVIESILIHVIAKREQLGCICL